MSEHSFFAPSSASRTLICPGSMVPDDSGTNDAAELGTKIHQHCADVLVDKPPEDTDYDAGDREFALDAVMEFVGYVHEVLRETGGELHVEQRLLSEIEGFGGTIDALIVTDTALHVIDLKTGYKFVPVEDNPQVACYLLLAKEKFPGRERFFGHIVQPRHEYKGKSEFTAAALAALRERVEYCIHSDDLEAGSHCKYCPLLSTCAEVRSKATELLSNEIRALPEPDPPLPEELQRQWEIAEMGPVIEALQVIARESLQEYLEKGGKVKNYKLTKTRPRRGWRDKDVAETTLGEMVGDDLALNIYEPTKLRSPAQIEKLGIRIPDELIFKPEARYTIARKEDPRDEENIGDEFD
jgi:hypothetical protein